MASATEILQVRRNTSELETTTYDDSTVSGLIDDSSVNLASGTIWLWKAAAYAELVNVSEAGASRAMSDLFKHAQEMAAYWTGKGEEETEATAGGHARVHTIQRTE